MPYIKHHSLVKRDHGRRVIGRRHQGLYVKKVIGRINGAGFWDSLVGAAKSIISSPIGNALINKAKDALVDKGTELAGNLINQYVPQDMKGDAHNLLSKASQKAKEANIKVGNGLKKKIRGPLEVVGEGGGQIQVAGLKEGPVAYKMSPAVNPLFQPGDGLGLQFTGSGSGRNRAPPSKRVQSLINSQSKNILKSVLSKDKKKGMGLAVL